MARKNINPFICQGYVGPDFFCDRVEETKKLQSMLYNGRNVTLISPRRLGKTGLIWHSFQQIKAENSDAVCIYIDIFPTKSQNEFVRLLGESILSETMSKSRQIGKKALELLGGLRPTIGIDPMTGLPNVSLSVEPSMSEITLKSLFNYLKKQQKEFFIAIDEFQQITSYPEKGTEALLRSQIQFASNCHFIFSGSKQHLMSEIFVSPHRPFYQSTDIMNLMPLDEQTYYDFASRFFSARGGSIDRGLFNYIYTTFDGYTWYIQSILNRLYESFRSVNEMSQIQTSLLSIVEGKAPQYETLAQFLTNNQFSLLHAIACEGLVEQPMGKDFIKKYNLSGSSSVKASIDLLTDKELVYRQPNGYIVYDRFLSIWLSRL